eukprot:5488984-Amphidinium_carterae.1
MEEPFAKLESSWTSASKPLLLSGDVLKSEFVLIQCSVLQKPGRCAARPIASVGYVALEHWRCSVGYVVTMGSSDTLIERYIIVYYCRLSVQPNWDCHIHNMDHSSMDVEPPEYSIESSQSQFFGSFDAVWG